MELRRVDRFASRHHGLITRDAAAAAGVSRQAWYRAIESGWLEPLHPRVARVHGSARTPEQRILAAVFAAGDRALASHRSAARLLGVARPDNDPIDIIVPNNRSPAPEGIVVHRPTDRADLAPTTRRGIRCTNELRTLCDLGAVAPESLAQALELFVTNGAIKPLAIRELLRRHGRRGRHGIGALREAIAEWPLGDQIPDSVLETAMARLLVNHELPAAEFHARVEGFEVDFLITGSPVVIECDGWSHHVANRDQWEFDLERGAVLSAAGYVVLHRSRRQVVFRAPQTAGRIRELVRRWAPDLLESAA